jgi:hypothetical protein
MLHFFNQKENYVTDFVNFDLIGFRMSLNRSQAGNGLKLLGLT